MPVGGYFKAQFKIMGVVAVILLVGFFMLHLKYAILWAHSHRPSGLSALLWDGNSPDSLGSAESPERQL